MPTICRTEHRSAKTSVVESIQLQQSYRQRQPWRIIITRMQNDRYRFQISLLPKNEGNYENEKEEEILRRQKKQPQPQGSPSLSIPTSNRSIVTVPFSLLTIPIFPLRKTVKLPTDNMTLNLYESRYIQMVEEAVLNTGTSTTTAALAATYGTGIDISGTNDQSSVPLFGAIYTTHLPHIVVPPSIITTSPNNPTENDKNSNTYIVPILEPNMIGSLFIVTNHTTTIQQNERKVIRLNATAILRFRIIKILHTGGYDDLLACSEIAHHVDLQENRQNKPYIVAQVQLLFSDVDTKFTREMDDNRSDCDIPSNDNKFNRMENADLPHYLSDILKQYGSNILSFGHSTSVDVRTLLETAWIKELLHFYNVTSSSHNDNINGVVPLYLEQKERLRILSK